MTTRLSTLAALAFALPVGAQEGVEAVTDIEEVSLEDLLETDTTVASSKSVQLRASPGVVTVVGREEIQRLGARDLLDLLPLVPGFDVGVDVTSVVGLSFRGNWAHEGKLLIMVDGVEMNEVLYQTSPDASRCTTSSASRSCAGPARPATAASRRLPSSTSSPAPAPRSRASTSVPPTRRTSPRLPTRPSTPAPASSSTSSAASTSRCTPR
jgi:hypothetical protein